MMKRGFDILASAVGLLLLFPFFVVISVWIKIDSPGPVFFRQTRMGRGFVPFSLFKFRSMNSGNSRNSPQITVANDSRVTSAGKFLRKSKIDELPQLINVLKGDMSLVGPRPEVPKYVELFKNEYASILTIRPGITDYAAIEFSNEESVLKKYENAEEGYITEVLPRKIELYHKYLRETGFWTDIKVLYLTMRKIKSS
jgi:lipopolysaccharide/colanic/teichoic acid biosynthesis glycosyltransferase